MECNIEFCVNEDTNLYVVEVYPHLLLTWLCYTFFVFVFAGVWLVKKLVSPQLYSCILPGLINKHPVILYILYYRTNNHVKI